MTVIFPKWTNHAPAVIAGGAVCGLVFAVAVVWYYFSPRHTDVGYAPDQPVLYSHKLHAGNMGMDCRYCHQEVEHGPAATVPTTATCMNCHKTVRTDSIEIQKIHEAYDSNMPIEWVKVHMLPDYAYFSHAAHVNINKVDGDNVVSMGIGCKSCHGRIDQMEVVRQVEPMSMGWCLDCHREPELHLRPADQVTNMSYEHDHELALSLSKHVNPPTDCSACHR